MLAGFTIVWRHRADTEGVRYTVFPDETGETLDGGMWTEDGVIALACGVLLAPRYESVGRGFVEGVAEYGLKFPARLRGECSGAVLGQERGLVWTNAIGSRRVFFARYQESTVVGTSMFAVARTLARLGKEIKLDPRGVAAMMTYGNMVGSITPIEGVERLLPGHVLELRSSTRAVQYHSFDVTCVERTREDALDGIEHHLRAAVDLAFRRDQEAEKRHLVALSGGLDSRVCSMLASELGYDVGLAFTFAESGSRDHRIAEKIARKEGWPWIFYSLSNGLHLHDLSGPGLINEGLVVSEDSAHGFAMFSNMNFEPYGILHTGQLGDALFGSYLGAATSPPKSAFFPMIQEEYRREVARYSRPEVFQLYHRGFSRIVCGNWTIQHFTDASSPFLNEDAGRFIFSLPERYRIDEKLYQDWIVERHPRMAAYVWDKSGARPGKRSVLGKAWRFSERGFRFLAPRHELSRLSSMNPTVHWFAVSSELNALFQSRVHRPVEMLGLDRALTVMLKNVQRTGTRQEQMSIASIFDFFTQLQHELSEV